MIKLDNVNKYFNRYKKNQIHVINNSSLNFPSAGLVALLGPSGCGKTTLLNVIGGLDKINSGHVYIDGNRITKRSSKKIDEIRNLNIGYIFQDYKLVENMNVFDNVSLSLKIIGIKDKEEIKRRVLYTLDKVNMLRYKNRPVNMLSGGERQRVGIARALVKNPKIIIADEPTGNLDSKNSLEIMDIIKSISSKYLVILVTHEEELAKFYANRIIELKDGKVIKDYENNFDRTLNYKIDNRIYLKDFKNIDNIKKDNINVSVYRDNNENLNISVVFKNGNIYIETKGNEKVEVIDKNSNIELIDDCYKEIKVKEVKENNFDIENNFSKLPEKYSSIFSLISFITYGFKKIINYPILKKILLAGFFLSGMFLFYSVSSIGAALHVKDEDFISINKKYLTANITKISVNDYLELENDYNIDYILPSNSLINLKFKYDKYLQTQFDEINLSGSLSDYKTITNEDIILGRAPINKNEVVIDKMILKNSIINNYTQNAGFFEIKDFLNKKVYINNLDDFIIVGITDKNEPNIYTDRNVFINIIQNSSDELYEDDDDIFNKNKILDYELLINKKIKLIEGSLPINDYEAIVNEIYKDEIKINDKTDLLVNNKKLKVVGYYKNLNDSNYEILLTNNNTIKYDLITKANKISVFSKNNKEVINKFHDKKINIKNSYDEAKSIFIYERRDSVKNTLIVSGVILGISLIEILLMIRSSFLSRIKEVGIYRAIGVKKSDIYKMFAGEIFSITIIASFTGILFMGYILYSLCKINYVNTIFRVDVFTFITSLLLVLIFNLVVGLLPVYNTIRKTPAQILSRFDIE